MKESELPGYQVIEGVIDRLQTQATHVHYLKNIKQNQQFASAVAMAQAAAEQAGAVLSAQAANDDGDPVEGFTMQVNGRVVQGSFWKVTFKNGDSVQIIGEERDGIFKAISVTKPDQRMIWMQPHCERGTSASAKSIVTKASFATVFIFLFGVVCSFLMNVPFSFTLMMSACLVTLIWSVMVIWSWRDFMAFAQEMNAVGVALGLPEPEKIDLFKSTKAARQAGKPDVPMGVYYY
jgi:hypothetical protein